MESSVWPQFWTYGRKILSSHPDCNGWSDWLVRTTSFASHFIGSLTAALLCMGQLLCSLSGFTLLILDEFYLEAFLCDMISVIYTQRLLCFGAFPPLCPPLFHSSFLTLPLILYVFNPFSNLANIVGLIQW